MVPGCVLVSLNDVPLRDGLSENDFGRQLNGLARPILVGFRVPKVPRGWGGGGRLCYFSHLPDPVRPLPTPLLLPAAMRDPPT